ncbi:MAG: fatty acid desaturase [Hyphomicrobium sp.]
MNVAVTDASIGRARIGRISILEMESLKTRDNWTNWRYLGINWLVIIGTLSLSIWAEAAARNAGYGWEVFIPIAVLTIIIIGASQHQLGGAIHEGTHFQLFANRTLNESASDWFAGFPIYTSTHHYRLHHMAHHQFVNDPERDPIFAQADESGHWLDFPLTHVELVKALLRLIWLPNLAKYTIARARHSALGLGKNPYGDPDNVGHFSVQALGIVFAVGLPSILIGLMFAGFNSAVVMTMFFALWTAAFTFYSVIPADWFPNSRIQPVFSHRLAALNRLSFMAILYGTLTAIDLTGYGKAWAYFGLYWIVPLFTMFPVFMIFREWLQHGNTDRGRYTNSRVLMTGPLFRYAVLPWGMDYHLPHHLMATVPHYNLKKFHDLLKRDAEYAEKAVIVEGLYGRANELTGRPTAFGALLVEHAPKKREAVYVDNAVLDRVQISDQQAVDREARLSRSAEGQSI